MANEKNVEALAAAFGGAFFKVCGGALDAQELLNLAREVIQMRGVLVPSAFEDDELLSWGCRLGRHPMHTSGSEERAASIRANLECIARGEEYEYEVDEE